MTFFSFIHQLRKYQSYVSTKITVVLVTDSFRFVFSSVLNLLTLGFANLTEKQVSESLKKWEFHFWVGFLRGYVCN